MADKSTLGKVALDKLKLDVNNPRFAELYSGSTKESDLIDYLLYNESAEDIADEILKIGEFYPDRPLWVIKDGEDYLVKDGNRRCAAVKALQFPTKYDLSSKFELKELPVLIYSNPADLTARIIQEHTNSLFREWDRIAKALEAYKLFKTGNSIDSMKEMDSQPIQLVKLASFYYEAVKTGGEDLKALLRRGRGKTGGKTIIFERLFPYSKSCGYYFKNKPSYEIEVTDNDRFEAYITALIKLLKKYPETKTQDVDDEKETFLARLKEFGFDYKESKGGTNSGTGTGNSNGGQNSSEPSGSSANDLSGSGSAPAGSGSSSGGTGGTGGKRKSVKTRPIYQRKRLPPTLEQLINECYSLDENNFYNAKTALTRVTFECTLKYVVENTIYKTTKNIADSAYLRDVFFDARGNKRPYTDFTSLKSKFTQLITNTGIKKAFESFDLEKSHQIIHNYHVGSHPADAKELCNNLMPLLEFMLQEEADLLNSIDQTKLA